MSTLTAWAKGPRALIANDTAGLDGEGVVRGWVNKIITVPHLRMAVTTQGAIAALPHLVTDLVAEFESFDAVVEGATEFFEAAHDRMMMGLADQSGCGEFRLAVVGWSTARRCCEAYAISSFGDNAFELVRNDLVVAPAPPLPALVEAGVLINGIIDDRDPAAMLKSMIEVQRRMRLPLGGIEGGRECFIIGGQLVLTEITEGGISQKIVRTWDDQIGSPLTPALAPQSLKQAAAPAMSRQQRRAAEASAQKVRAHAR